MKFNVLWAWYDLWIGAYWDVGHRTLYVCPLPTVVLRFEFSGARDEAKHRTDRSVEAQPEQPHGEWSVRLDDAIGYRLAEECALREEVARSYDDAQPEQEGEK